MPERTDGAVQEAPAANSRSSLRSIGERGLHLVWTVHFIITLGLVCTALGIILFDVMLQLFPRHFTSPHFNYMAGTAILLLLLAGANAPLCAMGRYYGVLRLHFLDHESYVLTSNDQMEESFVSTSGLVLMRLLGQLEHAPLMDRQAVRRQLRTWLDAHHAELTDRELDDVEERCPYLFDPAWRQNGLPNE